MYCIYAILNLDRLQREAFHVHAWAVFVIKSSSLLQMTSAVISVKAAGLYWDYFGSSESPISCLEIGSVHVYNAQRVGSSVIKYHSALSVIRRKAVNTTDSMQ